MRAKLTALVTATAIAISPAVAPAQPQVMSQQTQSDPGASSDAEVRNGSSYLKWLDENVATTEDHHLNNFLKLLVDFLIGAGIMLVVGLIYGQVARFLPL